MDKTEQPKEDEQGKKKSKSKRKLTKGESLARCPTYKLEGHILANCLYIFLEKAKGTFKGWKGVIGAHLGIGVRSGNRGSPGNKGFAPEIGVRSRSYTTTGIDAGDRY